MKVVCLPLNFKQHCQKKSGINPSAVSVAGMICTAPVICTEFDLFYTFRSMFYAKTAAFKSKVCSPEMGRWEVCTENLPDASENWMLGFRKAEYWQRGCSGPSEFTLPHTLPLKQLLKLCELQLLVYRGGKVVLY